MDQATQFLLKAVQIVPLDLLEIPLQPFDFATIGNAYQSASMRIYNAGRGEAITLNCQQRRDAFQTWLTATADSTGPKAIMQLFSEAPLCQTGQVGLFTVDAAILSPASGEFRITGLPPSNPQYVTWRFNDQP